MCTSYDKTYHHHIGTLNTHNTHARTLAHTRAHTHAHAHTHTHTHTHTHAHTHIHTHTHARTRTHARARTCVSTRQASPGRGVAWLGCVAAHCDGGAHAQRAGGTTWARPGHRNETGSAAIGAAAGVASSGDGHPAQAARNPTTAHARTPAGSAASCAAHCAALHHALRSRSTRGAGSLESHHQRHERAACIHCSRENS